MLVWISLVLVNHYAPTPVNAFSFQCCCKKSRSQQHSQCDPEISPLRCSTYHWRNVRLMSCTAFLVHPHAFWAPNLHRLYGSAAYLPQFHRVMYVKFVENTVITLKLWTDNFHQFCCCLYQQGHHSLVLIPCVNVLACRRVGNLEFVGCYWRIPGTITSLALCVKTCVMWNVSDVAGVFWHCHYHWHCLCTYL